MDRHTAVRNHSTEMVYVAVKYRILNLKRRLACVSYDGPYGMMCAGAASLLKPICSKVRYSVFFSELSQ
jgi:hypothetical protein